jgi:hypothetical protein
LGGGFHGLLYLVFFIPLRPPASWTGATQFLSALILPGMLAAAFLGLSGGTDDAPSMSSRKFNMSKRSPYAAGGTYHVFLSFSKDWSLRAAKVTQRWIDELLCAEVRVFFYGPEYAMVGEDWMQHVYEGAEDSDAFIAFLTRDNFDNYWIKEELEAVGRSARCRLVLLVLLDGLQPTDLPAQLQSRQAKLWSPDLLKNLLVLIGREAGVVSIEAAVKARGASISASFRSANKGDKN